MPAGFSTLIGEFRQPQALLLRQPMAGRRDQRQVVTKERGDRESAGAHVRADDREIQASVQQSWYEGREGRRLGSEYLIADSVHTRSDIYVTLGVWPRSREPGQASPESTR